MEGLLSKGLFDRKVMDSRTDPEKVGKKEVFLGHLIGPLGTIFVVNTIAGWWRNSLRSRPGSCTERKTLN